MIKKPISNKLRKKRHLRIRRKLSGDDQKPRLSVYRSNLYIYVQLIDDVNHNTLVAARSSETGVSGANIASAEAVGKLIAEKALAKGISEVVFDRSGYLYHGRIKALAEAAREAGLKF